ncbi:MAG: hypothetical protein Q7R78_02045 [bacterium]|nr:hypothetical protein [bacterium]
MKQIFVKLSVFVLAFSTLMMTSGCAAGTSYQYGFIKIGGGSKSPAKVAQVKSSGGGKVTHYFSSESSYTSTTKEYVGGDIYKHTSRRDLPPRQPRSTSYSYGFGDSDHFKSSGGDVSVSHYYDPYTGKSVEQITSSEYKYESVTPNYERTYRRQWVPFGGRMRDENSQYSREAPPVGNALRELGVRK